jgi:hypothetical protein
MWREKQSGAKANAAVLCYGINVGFLFEPKCMQWVLPLRFNNPLPLRFNNPLPLRCNNPLPLRCNNPLPLRCNNPLPLRCNNPLSCNKRFYWRCLLYLVRAATAHRITFVYIVSRQLRHNMCLYAAHTIQYMLGI